MYTDSMTIWETVKVLVGTVLVSVVVVYVGIGWKYLHGGKGQ